MKRLRRVRTVGVTAVTLVAVAFASFVGSQRFMRTVRPHAQLIAVNDFSVQSRVTAYPGCVLPTVSLYPGTTRCFTYIVGNPLQSAINVSSLSVAIDPLFPPPAGCSSSDLHLSTLAFSGSLIVPALGSGTVNKQITLADNGNQNACRNFTFHFLLSGTTTYTEVYGTGTLVSSSLNPSTVGQSVTYTATVTATAGRVRMRCRRRRRGR